MIKYRFRLVFSVITLVICFSSGIKAQLIGTGIVDDPSRNQEEIQPSSPNFRTQATTPVATYTDTLRLPFFEDFSGVVVSIDSVVISTSDNLVKIYDASLNAYSDGTPVFVGFEAPVPLTPSSTLSNKKWYIKKNATNEFLLDTSVALTTPMKFLATNIVYKNAFWRLVNNTYSASVDTLKWKAGSNVYINNRFPIEPLSFNVATFDGLKANGVPYNNVNVLAQGYGDELTSQPIDLSALVASDSIHFSFYWQHTGIGDDPEVDDYLEVQFKDTADSWITVQTIYGNIAYMDTFKLSVIHITDSMFRHKSFQFRFRSYGRLSGPYDIWNVDYIYLNKNRNFSDFRTLDITIGNAAVSFLKKYTSMPYGQYFADKINEIGTLPFTINDLDRGLLNSQKIQGVCYITTKVNAYSYLYKDTASLHTPNISTLTYSDQFSMPADSLKDQFAPMKVDTKYYVGLNDTINILRAYNNTFLTSTILWDYYAYDDGTPEWGVAANEMGAKVANKFTLNIEDTLTHIDIYFTKSKGPNMEGRSILLSVWNDKKVLVNDDGQEVQVKYGGFKRYKLKKPIVVSAGKSVYVGYQQGFSELLTVGYDRNYDHSDKVYFNTDGSSWNIYSAQPGYTKGSMMIRPVFSKGQLLVTPVIDKEENFDVVLYPIPSDDLLKIQGHVSKITLYDMMGRVILYKTFNPYEEEKNIDVSSLSNGLFIAEIKINGSTFVKRIIVQHAY